MYYHFNKLVMHNFLSFGDATITLNDRGYCLIEGKNHNPSDRALSNGSGKSSIISAISWVLTGQTIQNISTNIENINSTGGCFVELTFNVDSDEYVVTRYKNHETFKTDLKITINGEDKSGKGIRESSNLLAQYLPELSSQLLTSVILLGQGLPNSFTKNTPSGRKDLLENLTKSNFMIQDVKDRISKRYNYLTEKDRDFEKNILEIDTSLEIYNNELIKKNNELLNYSDKKDYVKLISENEKIFNEYSESLKDTELAYNNDNELLVEYKRLKNEVQNKLFEEKKAITDIFNDKNLKRKEESFNLKRDIDDLTKQINDFKNIKDICPTCGQKIPNVIKKDTTELENRKALLSEQYQQKQYEIINETTKHNKEISEKESRYNAYIKDYDMKIKNLEKEYTSHKLNINSIQKKLNDLLVAKNILLAEEKLFDTNKKKLEEDIANLKKKVVDLEENKLYNSNERSKLQDHIDVISKINTLVKRDFRGYLLLDIIDYVQKKAKEYCKYIFNTDDIKIYLDGNDIDIEFSKKQFESLSGGEKQKLDVIIQFAIRDMMSNYSNFHSNILFLDEITDNLDSKGCDGLINLISNTLNDLESIFIVSHHADELSFPVDNTIVVEKDYNGISRIM